MFKSLLLPVDLAARTGKRRTLEVAVDLQRHWQAELHFLAVVPDFGMSIVGAFFDDGFSARALAEVTKQLDQFCGENVPAGLTYRQHVAQGSIYDQILGAADSLKIDCIVMGSHRPARTDHLLGPNAARVVRHAPCTVVVVRDH